MNAELLRRTADKMRAQAEAAAHDPDFGYAPSDWFPADHITHALSEAAGDPELDQRANGTYIAAMTPAVGIAVADSMYLAADWMDLPPGSLPPWVKHALTVARAYREHS